MNVLPDTALASLREPCSHTTAVMNIPPCLAIPFSFFSPFSPFCLCILHLAVTFPQHPKQLVIKTAVLLDRIHVLHFKSYWPKFSISDYSRRCYKAVEYLLGLAWLMTESTGQCLSHVNDSLVTVQQRDRLCRLGGAVRNENVHLFIDSRCCVVIKQS